MLLPLQGALLIAIIPWAMRLLGLQPVIKPHAKL